MKSIYLIILAGLYGLFDRLREITVFDSWLTKWLNFWNIPKDSFWGKWWGSVDCNELSEWYLYLLRDGYHTFKNACVLLFFILLYKLTEKDKLKYLIIAFVTFGIVQLLFDMG